MLLQGKVAVVTGEILSVDGACKALNQKKRLEWEKT